MLTLFIIAFSYLSFSVLAPWQLNKNHDIAERNKQIERAYEADPVPAEQALTDTGAIEPGDEWTRVTMTGKYLPDSEVLLRLRPAGTGPSYQSLIAFQADSGLTLLVNRGWLPAGEANAVPEIPAPPQGTQTISGMVRDGERLHDSQPIDREGYQQVYSINTEQIGELTSIELGEDYVQLSDATPGVLNPMPVPKLDTGSHLSYGLQWIAFGIMAPIGLFYFVYSEIKERRRVREEAAELPDAPSSAPDQLESSSVQAATEPAAGPAAGPATDPATEAAPQKPRKRANYGSQRR